MISAGNSALYLASRILVGLAREGRAPAILGTTNSRGVPWPALLLSNGMGLLSLLKYIGGTASGQVFSYLMSLSGVSTFVCWAGECFVTAGLDFSLTVFFSQLLRCVMLDFVRRMRCKGGRWKTCPSVHVGFPTVLTLRSP